MKYQHFRGTGVAIITPFKNGEIDWDSLAHQIDYVIEGGVEYVVSLGTTGEAVNLSAEECRQILDFTIERVNKRVLLVAGLFGGNYTKRLVDQIKGYNFKGLDAIMSSSPAYIKPSQSGIYQHYMAIAEASPLPVLIYNVPGRTASNIEADTLIKLSHASDNFIGVKEASGDLVQATKIMKNKHPDFLVISGDDPTAFALTAMGGDGVVSVIANAYPKHFSDMIRAAMKGDRATAARINYDLIDMHQWLYADGNPSGIKAALHLMGKCENELRLPLTPVSEPTFEGLKKEMMVKV